MPDNRVTNRWANPNGGGIAASTLASTTTSVDPDQATISASRPWVANTIAIRGDRAPQPNPLSFSVAPSAVSTTSITMTAETATTTYGPVEYYFTATSTGCGASYGTGATDSGWQSSTSYTDTGLDPNKCYSYTVMARDVTGTTTTVYTVMSTYTLALLATLSGTIYTDAGTTEDTAGGVTLSLKVDGAGSYSTTTTAGSGDWYIESVTLTATSTITVWLDGATEKGVTVTVASSTEHITGLDIYAHHVIVKNESPTGTTTITHLATYDSTDDADIPYTVVPFICGVFTVTGDNDITYGTVLGEDGNCWLDRNLGASRVATASNDSQSYGYYYQWGRLTDGHQISTSDTTSTLSSADDPGHDDFILINSGLYDWRSPQNNNLWQGVSGTNNVCPTGFRLPTNAEWITYVASSSITNSATAYSSNLKLPVAGYRDHASGAMDYVGSYGSYWSSSVAGTKARSLDFYGSYVNPSFIDYRAYGVTVRCLKDSDSFINLSISSLLIHASTTLYVAPYTTFAPEGAVTVAGNATQNPYDGTLHLPNHATYIAGGDTTLAGSYRASSSATFTNAYPHTLTLNATTTGKTLAHEPTASLGNVIFSGVAGAWTFAQNATTTNLTVATGTVTFPPSLTLTGDYRNTGTALHTGTTTFASTSPQTLSGTMNTPTTDFNHLVFSGIGTKTFTDTASTTNVTVGLGSTLTLGGTPDDGLVGHWTFDEGDIVWDGDVAATTTDVSGYGNHGTIVGATPVPGVLGQGMEFDGVGDYIDLPNFSVGTIHTFSAWVRSLNAPGANNDSIINEEISDGVFEVGNDEVLYGPAWNDTVSVNFSGPINDVFHHLVVVRNTASVVFYLDGLQVGAIQTLGDGSNPFIVSAIGEASKFYGYIDDVRIYNRALSAEEVKRLYDNGRVTLDISGDFTNSGTLVPNESTVLLTGTDQSITGTTTFHHLTKVATTSATTTFSAGDLFTITGNWTMHGTTTAPHVVQSSVPGEHWYVDPQGGRSIQNIWVQDSYNMGTLINCVLDHFCTDLGNNVNWNFIFFGSDRDEQFYVGQATTTLSRLTFMEGLSGTAVRATNDIRITIPHTVTDFRFDTDTTTLTFGGTGAKKVSPTVSYEDDGRTLVIDVLSDFSRSDMLLVDGMRVGSFLAISTTTAHLALHLDGNTTGEPASYDVRTVRITGAIERGDHSAGQVANAFSFLNGTDNLLFRFALTPLAEHATMTAFALDLAPIHRMEGLLTNIRLYHDVNGDGVVDGGDVLVGGVGVLTSQGIRGSITFSEPFTLTEASEYLLVADRTGDTYARLLTVHIPASGMHAVGMTSGVKPVVLGSVTPAEHRHGRIPQTGGRDGGEPVGGAGPVGTPTSGGGSGGGSTPTPPQEEETIGDDTRFKAPQVSGAFFNQWGSGANALASNNTYATTSVEGHAQSYSTFSFGIPSGDTIMGVTVKLEASAEGGAGGTLNIALSWNGGVNYTSGVPTLTLGTSDSVYTVGGENDTWGASWTPAYFTDGTFVVRVIAHPDGNIARLDALRVYVKHAQTGGGSGGGADPI